MRVALLLSGGVDSSVALRLLSNDRQYRVEAFYLKVWLEDELSYLGNCPWEEDLDYARQVCDDAGVPFHLVSMQKEYYERIVQYALEELAAGRTPSPDIFCNRRIKFGLFPERIDPSFERIASGHYARIKNEGGSYQLLRSPDPVKDQTYFLSHQGQEQIARSLFPIGGFHKHQVRSLARELDLPNKERKDSQGICFLGKIRYREFVKHYLGEKPGDIVEGDTGTILGEHPGYWFYTIGQRQGLGLAGGPWYVSGKDTDSNRVFVAHKEDLEDGVRSKFHLSRLNWIDEAPSEGAYEIKIRHGPELNTCRIEWESGDRIAVELNRGDSGIAPGQFGVLYDGEVCLGGGTID